MIADRRSQAFSRFTHRWSLPAVVALTAVTLVASLTWPLGHDQGVFSWIARTVRSGGVLYRDAWNTTGPAAHVPFVLAQVVFGENVWGIRVVDAAILLSTTLLLALVVRSLTSHRTAAWTAALLGLWYLSGTHYATAQPDGWVTLLFLTTVVALWSGSRARRTDLWLVAGLVVGVSSLVKLTYLALGVVVCAPLLLRESRRLLAGIVARQVAALALGFAVPIVICVVWYSRAGALDILLDVYVNYVIEVYSRTGPSSLGHRLRGMAEHFQTSPLATLLIGSTVLVTSTLRHRHRALTLSLWCWIALAACLVALQNKFFNYHWLSLYPPMAVLSAVGFHELLDLSTTNNSANAGHDGAGPAPARLGRMLGCIWVGLIAVQCGLRPAYESLRLAGFVTGAIDRAAYDEGFRVPASSQAAAAYLRQHTTARDHVVIWGWNASVLYLAGRTSGSRFGFSMPLVLGPGSRFRSAYRREFLAALRNAPPSHVVVETAIIELFGEPSRVADFPEFNEIVAHCYRADTEFASIVVYRFSADLPTCSLRAPTD